MGIILGASHQERDAECVWTKYWEECLDLRMKSWEEVVGNCILTEDHNLYACPPAYLWLLSPCGPWPIFGFFNLNTVGRTSWTGDQPFARPLPTQRTTQTQNKRIQTSMSRVGFEPTIPASEDGWFLRPRGLCIRPQILFEWSNEGQNGTCRLCGRVHVEKPERKRPFGRYGHRGENMKMDP
jgi:hypothetical protein